MRMSLAIFHQACPGRARRRRRDEAVQIRPFASNLFGRGDERFSP